MHVKGIRNRHPCQVKLFLCLLERMFKQSPTPPRPSAADAETVCGKERNAVSKRLALTDLETDCGKPKSDRATRPVCHKKLPEKFKDLYMC